MQRQSGFVVGATCRAAVLLLLLSGMAGCRAPKPGPPPRPAPRWPGVSLTVQCPSGAARRLLETYGRAWAYDVGAKLAITDEPGTAPPSVVVLPPVALAAHAAGDRADPLADASETAAFLPLYRVRLLHWDTRTFALPLIGDGVLCVYREDLYGDGELRSAYRSKHGVDLAPPATWDEFARQTAFFADRRGKPSLAPLPRDDAGLDREYFCIAAPLAVRAATGSLRTRGQDDPSRAAFFSFQYDAVTGEPRIAGPGFVEALRLMQQLTPWRSKKPDAVAALREDDAVLGIVTLPDLAALRGSNYRWGVTRVPGSRRVYDGGAVDSGPINFVPYVGSTGMLGVVPRGAPHPDAAFALLLYLCGDTVSQEVVHDPQYGSGPFREAHLTKQSAGWFNYGLDEANTARLREVLREIADPRLDNPGLALRTPDQKSHRAALLAAIRRAIADHSDPAAALAEVDRQWRELDGDPAKARSLFRKSLGL